MKEKKPFLPALFIILFIFGDLLYKAEAQVDYVEGKWSGTVSLHQKAIASTR